MWQLIDFQRSAQDCINKMLEYKNRGLNLQMIAPVNSLITRPDDVPNGVRYYKLSPNGEKPQWEDPPSGQILNALMQVFNVVIEQMNRVASYEDVKAESNVAAKTTQAVIEQSMARWQSFLGDLAQWWSKTMRHCLLLVARYYTEPRTVQIRGRMGWESIPDFKGAHLLGQTNVRVFPGSAGVPDARADPGQDAVLRADGLALAGARDGRDRRRPGREADRRLRPGRRQGQPDPEPDPRRLGDGDADPAGDDRDPRPDHRPDDPADAGDPVLDAE